MKLWTTCPRVVKIKIEGTMLIEIANIMLCTGHEEGIVIQLRIKWTQGYLYHHPDGFLIIHSEKCRLRLSKTHKDPKNLHFLLHIFCSISLEKKMVKFSSKTIKFFGKMFKFSRKMFKYFIKTKIFNGTTIDVVMATINVFSHFSLILKSNVFSYICNKNINENIDRIWLTQISVFQNIVKRKHRKSTTQTQITSQLTILNTMVRCCYCICNFTLEKLWTSKG